VSRGSGAEICAFCNRGQLRNQEREFAFRQRTDRGFVVCRVVVPVGICDECGCETISDAAERIMEEAVRQEYEKMPRQGS
jgi:hypothetical protein